MINNIVKSRFEWTIQIKFDGLHYVSHHDFIENWSFQIFQNLTQIEPIFIDFFTTFMWFLTSDNFHCDNMLFETRKLWILLLIFYDKISHIQFRFVSSCKNWHSKCVIHLWTDASLWSFQRQPMSLLHPMKLLQHHKDSENFQIIINVKTKITLDFLTILINAKNKSANKILMTFIFNPRLEWLDGNSQVEWFE